MREEHHKGWLVEAQREEAAEKAVEGAARQSEDQGGKRQRLRERHIEGDDTLG